MRALRTAVVLSLSACLALGASPATAAEGAWDAPPVAVVDAGANRPVALTTVGSRVIAVWKSISASGFTTAYSDDSGQTWSTPQMVGYGDLTAGDSIRLVVTGSAVTVVQDAWDDNSSDMFIFATASSDAGETWGTVQQVSTSTWEQLPRASSNGSHTAVAWLHDGPTPVVAFSAAPGGGPGWSPLLDLSGAASVSDLDIAADDSRIAVVWQEWAGTLRFRSSTDDGATWVPALTEPATPISATHLAGASRVRALVHDGLVTVAWFADYGAGLHVWSSSSADGGATWSTPVQHSDTAATSNQLHLIATDAGVALAWNNGASYLGGGGVIRVSTSSDGVTWTTPVDVSDPGSTEPQLAAVDGNLVVAWMADDPIGSSSAGLVATRVSTDGGLSWGDPVLLGIETIRAFTPALTVVDRTVVLASRDRAIPGSVLASAYTFPAPVAPQPRGGLAATGTDAALPLGLAAGMLGLGAIALAVTRRIHPGLAQSAAAPHPRDP